MVDYWPQLRNQYPTMHEVANLNKTWGILLQNYHEDVLVAAVLSLVEEGQQWGGLPIVIKRAKDLVDKHNQLSSTLDPKMVYAECYSAQGKTDTWKWSHPIVRLIYSDFNASYEFNNNKYSEHWPKFLTTFTSAVQLYPDLSAAEFEVKKRWGRQDRLGIPSPEKVTTLEEIELWKKRFEQVGIDPNSPDANEQLGRIELKTILSDTDFSMPLPDKEDYDYADQQEKGGGYIARKRAEEIYQNEQKVEQVKKALSKQAQAENNNTITKTKIKPKATNQAEDDLRLLAIIESDKNLMQKMRAEYIAVKQRIAKRNSQKDND